MKSLVSDREQPRATSCLLQGEFATNISVLRDAGYLFKANFNLIFNENVSETIERLKVTPSLADQNPLCTSLSISSHRVIDTVL